MAANCAYTVSDFSLLVCGNGRTLNRHRLASLTIATILIVRANPTYIPLCFPASGEGTDANASALNCPTGSDVT